MADDKLRQKLVDYVEDAHTMERSISKMLDSMISTTDDPEIRNMLEHHKRETEEHERRLRERLADKAGDNETAEVARQNRADEEAMARKIHSNWDRFLDLTLATPGFSGTVSTVRHQSGRGSARLWLFLPLITRRRGSRRRGRDDTFPLWIE